MNHAQSGYGLWSLVLINSAIFIIFAFSFTKPKTTRDWRSLGAFSAFIVALFTEMYGFPLTIYLLSGWLSRRFPSVDLFSHDSGHLWYTLLGWSGNPHLNPIHLLSNLFIIAGFIVVARSWPVLHSAQVEGRLATGGPYSFVRHPQYAGFVLVMTGFLVQWPTLLTLLMFPILLVVYTRLAANEENEVRSRFPAEYEAWARTTPRFLPALGGSRP
jgi:protein-S-isoprenylcysteine O-methyltransferase Ste14